VPDVQEQKVRAIAIHGCPDSMIHAKHSLGSSAPSCQVSSRF
jgi:hypothetical protein